MCSTKPLDQSVLAFIKDALCEMLALPPSHIDADANLIDLGAQSFDFIDLTFRLERRFNVRLAIAFTTSTNHTVRGYVDAVIAASALRPQQEPMSG